MTEASKTSSSNESGNEEPKTLSIDIGGTGIKASVLDIKGEMVADRVRSRTPKPSIPDAVVSAIISLAGELPRYDRISVGFPGVVRGGVTYTAPNLGTSAWRNFNLAQVISDELGRPTRVVNDADMQGLAAVTGEEIEFVITLGTGFGSALFLNGQLLPHLELGQHPAHKDHTYDQYLGNAARKKVGDKRWNRRVETAIHNLHTLICYDLLHIGGGNSRRIKFELPDDIRLVDNRLGVLGGIALWERCDSNGSVIGD